METSVAKRPMGVRIPGSMAGIRPTSWAHRFALLCMLVFVAKVGDLLPSIGSAQLGKVFIGAALLVLIFEGGGWWESVFQHPVVRVFMAIAAIALITAPFGIWPGNSVSYLIQVFAKDLIFMFLLIISTTNYDALRRVIWTYAISATIIGYALIYFGVPGIAQFHLGKNESAMLSVLATALMLPLPARGLGRLAKIATIVLLVASVLLSGSRGSYLGIAVVLAVFTYLRIGKKLAVTAMILALVAYVGYRELPSDITGNVESIVNYEQDYNVTAPEGRLEIWKRGLTMIEERPLTGVGISNFPVAEGLMHRYVVGQPWMNAHNSFIQVAAETGILGLIAFIVLLKRLYAVGRRLRQEGDIPWAESMGFSLFLAFVGFMVTGFFLHAAFATIFYVLIAIHVAADRIAAEARSA
jgi:hypothetical protein